MAKQKPLWQAMRDAWWNLVDTDNPSTNPPEEAQWAAVLRTIADIVVPEHECPDGDSIQRAMWLTKARIRDRLLDEADLAEQEGITPPPTEPEYADP